MMRVFDDSESTEHFTRSEHVAADRFDHRAHADSRSMGVIDASALCLAKSDGGHLQKTALDRRLKAGVPFHAVDQEDGVTCPSGGVDADFNSVGSRAQRQ